MASGFSPLDLADLAELGYAPKHFKKPKPTPVKCDANPTPADRALVIEAMIAGNLPAVRELLVAHGQLTPDATDAQISAIIDTVKHRMPYLFKDQSCN